MKWEWEEWVRSIGTCRLGHGACARISCNPKSFSLHGVLHSGLATRWRSRGVSVSRRRQPLLHVFAKEKNDEGPMGLV